MDHQCKHILKRGPCKGARCPTAVKVGADMCAKHRSKAAKAKKEEGKASIDCSICMESIATNNKYYLPCGHVFHKNCVATWLDLNESCPMCRAKYEPVRVAPPPLEMPPPLMQQVYMPQRCAYPEIMNGGFTRCQNEACYNMPYCATHAHFILEYAYGDEYARAYAWDPREFA